MSEKSNTEKRLRNYLDSLHNDTAFLIDTIPERTDPAFLDLSVEQLFIDTSRNSSFFQALIDWQPDEHRISAVKDILDTITQTFRPTLLFTTDIPRTFITIKKLNGEYILYDRCDGIEPIHEISDSAIIIHGTQESDAYAIIQVAENDSQKLTLSLQGYPGVYPTPIPFSIEKTEEDYVYKIHGPHYSSLVIPIEYISEFDLLVNYSPREKRLEFQGFDKN
ncbi:MAG: hypothetical protein AAF655_06960 [Bacteroidota bacterium]